MAPTGLPSLLAACTGDGTNHCSSSSFLLRFPGLRALFEANARSRRETNQTRCTSIVYVVDAASSSRLCACSCFLAKDSTAGSPFRRTYGGRGGGLRMQIEERPKHEPDVNKCIPAITTFPTMYSMSDMCNMSGKHVNQTCTLVAPVPCCKQS